KSHPHGGRRRDCHSGRRQCHDAPMRIPQLWHLNGFQQRSFASAVLSHDNVEARFELNLIRFSETLIVKHLKLADVHTAEALIPRHLRSSKYCLKHKYEEIVQDYA